MLKQNKRLSGRLIVQTILKEGHKMECPLFILFKQKNQLGINRYAVIIGKKSEKLAVKRNLYRRRMYEAIRLVEKENPRQNMESCDTVILVRNACKKASLNAKKSTLLKLL